MAGILSLNENYYTALHVCSALQSLARKCQVCQQIVSHDGFCQNGHARSFSIAPAPCKTEQACSCAVICVTYTHTVLTLTVLKHCHLLSLAWPAQRTNLQCGECHNCNVSHADSLGRSRLQSPYRLHVEVTLSEHVCTACTARRRWCKPAGEACKAGESLVWNVQPSWCRGMCAVTWAGNVRVAAARLLSASRGEAFTLM